MALLKTFTNERTGLTVPNAYTIVTAVNWDKKLNVAQASIEVYVNQQVREQNLISGSLISLTAMLPEGVLTVDQVYAHLKTLPEFAGAVDA